MYEPTHLRLEKLWWLIISMLMLIATLLAFSRLVPAPQASASVAAASPVSSTTYDSSNVLTNGAAMVAGKFTGAMTSTGQAIDSGRRSAAKTASQSGRVAVHGLHNSVSFVGHGLSSSATFTERAVGSSVAVIAHVPSTILSFAADTPTVSAVIKPAEATPVPKIDPALPAAIATRTALPAAKTVSQVVAPLPIDSAPAWPIHGAITTLFGVPHWPYQPTHTGIDISDGQPSGVTPVKPFKPGRVIDVVHSSSGFGNHVIIDHGQGVTSLYGHLAATNVQIGQAVDKTTVLGLEGSTGASTGTHLHFEIRVNGQPTDPRQFVSGQP